MASDPQQATDVASPTLSMTATNGKPWESASERTRLICENLHIVQRRASRYAVTGTELGELYQHGVIALICAVSVYSQSEALADYVEMHVAGHLSPRAARRRSRLRRPTTESPASWERQGARAAITDEAMRVRAARFVAPIPEGERALLARFGVYVDVMTAETRRNRALLEQAGLRR